MRRTEYLTEKRDFQQLAAELLMEQEVMTCLPTDSGRFIASQMTKFNFGSLPVVDDDGNLVGLVSEFDLLKALIDGRDLKLAKAEEIMSRDVKTVQIDTPVNEVIRLLEKEHLIRVPVLKGKKLAGILARRDVLFGYIKATAEYWP